MALSPIWRKTLSPSVVGVEDYKGEELECQDEELRKKIIA